MIRIAIGDTDQEYTDRLLQMVNRIPKIHLEMEVHAFSTKEAFLSCINSEIIDIALVDKNIEINRKDVPDDIIFAYFSDSRKVETIKSQPAICKYQKVEIFRKDILSLYAEKEQNITSYRSNSEYEQRILVFQSAEGGSGASAVAVACSKAMCASGFRVLYIDLDQFAAETNVFHGDGNQTFSDIIMALKRKKTNLTLKLKGGVTRDPSGIEFFKYAEKSLDMSELNRQNIEDLFTELKKTGEYHYIVVNQNFSFEEKSLQVCDSADHVIFVTEGTPLGNSKFSKVFESIRLLEQQNKVHFMRKIKLLYNKVHGDALLRSEVPVTTIGSIPFVNSDNFLETTVRLSTSSIFRRIG